MMKGNHQEVKECLDAMVDVGVKTHEMIDKFYKLEMSHMTDRVCSEINRALSQSMVLRESLMKAYDLYNDNHNA
jgi:hypothetical protein